MTDQEEIFVEAYLANGFNTTGAARQAGYSDPNGHGHRVRSSPEVSAVIESRLAEFRLSANEVLTRLAAIANSDMDDFLNVEEGVAMLDLNKAKQAQKLHQVKSFSFSRKSGLKIELYDKKSALDTLAKAHGLLVDRSENHNYDMKDFNDDEIDRIAAGESIDRVLASSRRRRAGETPEAAGAGASPAP